MKQCEADMLMSLANVITKVGGNPKVVLHKGITVLELIETLAPNGVRFEVSNERKL